MHIGILSHAGNRFAGDYAAAFASRGHSVTFYSLGGQPPTIDGVAVRSFGSVEFTPSQSKSRLPYLGMILPIRWALRYDMPDVVYAIYLTSAGVLACLSGHRTIVLGAHGGDVNANIANPVWRCIFRWQARRARLIHVVSEPLAVTLSQRAGLPQSRVILAPVGADTRLLGLIASADRPHRNHILCTRGHTPVYDQITLVRALARLRDTGVDFHVTFGDGRQAEATRRLITQHKLLDWTTFLGGYTLNQLPAIFAAADIYVSTSISDGTSSALLEALSTGTFPVVSDIPANRPWVRHEQNGLLFQPGDDAMLAVCLRRAMADSGLRASAAESNHRLVVDNGDCNDQVDKLLARFRDLRGIPC